MLHWRSSTIRALLLAVLIVQACAPIGEKAAQDKKKAKAARNLGEAYISEGNYTGALKELLKAEKLNPDDPLLHNDLGLVYMAKDKYDRAVAHFEKAIELQPDYSLAKNNLGSAYMIRKEWDKAIPILEDVTGDMLYATPHFPLTNLGWAYFNKGDYNKAQRYLKKALKLKPDFFLARLHMGQTHLATGRLHQALTTFEQLAAEQPKDPTLLLELGKTYRLMGDYDSARLVLKGAIEYTENNELAVEASEELKKLYR